ncbi:hypothetical protein [Pisciglobus halotolerans]|uniref:Uncharacterized protein n=1 Tax=Pisciglobus halotolerans TaxID=745365 RepID=A0A1I3BJ80_9LACT|nr:hypothetical protein [Pisciglobus halotolerans]SFH62210.1 hypothetical protein SAMN04489868_1077 [Pisciglobus halotolerans]
MNKRYQLIGLNTKNVYKESIEPEELHRWMQIKFPTPRTDKDRSTFSRDLMPEPMRIERKKKTKKD